MIFETTRPPPPIARGNERNSFNTLLLGISSIIALKKANNLRHYLRQRGNVLLTYPLFHPQCQHSINAA